MLTQDQVNKNPLHEEEKKEYTIKKCLVEQNRVFRKRSQYIRLLNIVVLME